MIRNRLLQNWLLTLVCVALLVVRVGGAHLHLCFDGQEQPASVHVLDLDEHHSDGSSAPHQDADVEASSALAAKVSKSSFDLPLWLFGALVLFILARPSRGFVPRPSLDSRLSPVPFLRPPSRGPPAYSLTF